ncbi:MAG: hypothetical protein LBQ42_12060 [Synergistaceae bacterium]|nr:hypothetical protein [Synergistaceae bacterium]
MKTKKGCARHAYALSSTMALVFLLTVLLGVVVAHIGHSLDVMSVHLRRIQARSELVSMTNSALKWLSTEFKMGKRPRAPIVDLDENLTDFDSLSIFSSCNVKEDVEGNVEVFDLDYNPENLVEPVVDPLLFPPSFPRGYMIRAVVAQKGLASLMMESVYRLTLNDVPGVGGVYVFETKPVYWKEWFR